MTPVGTQIRSYILKEFIPADEANLLENDTPLVSSGVVSSLQLMKLVSFIEEQFGVPVEPHEMSADYLDTVEQIESLVVQKQKKKGK